MPRTCNHPGCFYPVFSGGFCIRHYSFSPKGRAAWLATLQKPKANRKPQVQRSFKAGIPTQKGREDSTSGPKVAKSGRFWTAVEVADTWFSRYMKLVYMKEGNVVQCVTHSSGHGYFDIKAIQCGHFQGRENMATRWDFKNVGPQCGTCNFYKQGAQKILGRWIDRQFGPGTADRMEVMARLGRKFNEFEVRAIAEHFKSEFTKLAAEKGDPWKK